LVVIVASMLREVRLDFCISAIVLVVVVASCIEGGAVRFLYKCHRFGGDCCLCFEGGAVRFLCKYHHFGGDCCLYVEGSAVRLYISAIVLVVQLDLCIQVPWFRSSVLSPNSG
jgi:hypothetical protein